MSVSLKLLDYITLAIFIVFWIGTNWLIAYRASQRPGVHDLIKPLRSEWMRQVQLRGNRIADAALIGHLMHSATFFSSTTALILGGLLALMGTMEKSVNVVKNLPFAVELSQQVLEIKALVLIVVFILAFVRFTWSLRQFALVTILIGAMPDPMHAGDRRWEFAHSAGRLMGLAGDNFTKGLRTYYFAIPVLCWFVHPLLFLVASVTVAGTIYWMDFHSKTLAAIREGQGTHG